MGRHRASAGDLEGHTVRQRMVLSSRSETIAYAFMKMCLIPQVCAVGWSHELVIGQLVVPHALPSVPGKLNNPYGPVLVFTRLIMVKA